MAILDLRFPEFEWRKDYPRLARYVDRVAERPSFRAYRSCRANDRRIGNLMTAVYSP
jgi:glutathione S-transferase